MITIDDNIKRMKSIFITFLMFMLSCPIFAQTADREISQQYKRSQLIQHTANVCISGNTDENACSVLDDAAREFNIQVLNEYATLLRNRRIDFKNKKAIEATTALLSKAEELFGNETMEAARCRRACICANFDIDIDKSLKLSEENVSAVKNIYEKEKGNWKNEEFYLLCRLENILLKENVDAENPLLYAEAYEIELQTDSLYRIYEEDSEEKIDLYRYMAYMKPTYSDFSNYLNVVYHELFPDDTRIPSMLYNDILPSNALGYYEAAAEMAKRIFGENDLRTLSIETDLWIFKCDNIGLYDEAYVKLNDIERKLRTRLHPDDNQILNVRKAMWECDIRAGKRLDETNDYQDYLNKMNDYYGEYSQTYLYCLYDILNQRQRVDIKQALVLLDELKKIAETIYKDDMISLAQIYASTAGVVLGLHDSDMADKHISKTNTIFDKGISDIKIGKIPLTWKAVLVARYLCEIYSLSYNKGKHLNAGKCLIEMEKSLAEYRPLVYVLDWLDYSSALAYSKKYDEALRICDEAETILQSEGKSCSRVYYDKLNIFDAKGDSVSYKNTLCEAVKETEGDDGWNCYFKLILASVMCADPESPDKGEALMQEAYQQFIAMKNEINGVFFEDYFIINEYLQRNQRFKEADTLLLQGLERYNSVDGRYTEVFIRFLTEIVGLYKDHFENYDKAESFLERHLRNLIDNPSNVNHDLTLKLLWLHYSLLRTKSNNDDKILNLLQLMVNEVDFQVNQIEDETYKKHFAIEHQLPILGEVINIWIPQIENLKNEIRRASSDSYYAQYKDVAISKLDAIVLQIKMFSSQLIEIDDYFKSIYPDYLNKFEYINFIRTASLISLYIDKDTIKAENWLQKGLKATDKPLQYRAYYQFADFNMNIGRYSDAVKFYKETVRLMEEMQYIGFSNKTKANLNLNLSLALYKNGQYDEAINNAMIAHNQQKELFKKNIDLMTQAEREDYLAIDGMGNSPLYALLPHNPRRLSADVYNAILMEKGFLLRASERIHNAITNFDDVELKSLLDSLGMMNERYKRMELMKTDYTNFNIEYSQDAVKLQQQIEQLERNINRKVKNMANLKDESVTWDDVKNVLGKTDVAVEFVISDSILGALIVKKDYTCPLYVQLCNSMPIIKWLTDKVALDARNRAEAIYQRDDLSLYLRIWEPLEKHLAGMKHIYFSPTGYLNSFSLAAVRCPDGSCMMDHYIIHQLTSTAQLTKPGNFHSTLQKEIALFGAVYYSEEQRQDEETYLASLNNQKDTAQYQTAQRGAVEDSFRFLPFTRNEVKHIESLFEKHDYRCLTQLGQNASEQQFRQISGKSPYILHLATHGFFIDTEAKVMQSIFLSQFPAVRLQGMQRAGMALAGANKTWEEGNQDTDNDGILTAAEVAALNLDNTQLAVLSACNTGVGFFSNEGVYGMYRGFKQAGVKSILSSLWTVNDFSTSILIQKFYEKWLEGLSMQQAYQQAISDVRQNFQSPYYWAPFVLIDAIE